VSLAYGPLIAISPEHATELLERYCTLVSQEGWCWWHVTAQNNGLEIRVAWEMESDSECL
jgi:hypothetical protein